MSPEQMRERYRPVDSQTRNPAAPYRCQEMRQDVDRVLLGRAHPDISERYHAHRAGCTSCQSFHRNMRALYEGPGHGPTRLEQESEFQGILERARREAEPETPQRRLMWLAPVAAAAALLLTTLGGGNDRSPESDEIVLEEGLQPRASFDGTRIPDRVGAFGHRAQAFGRVLGGSLDIVDKEGGPAAPQSFQPGASFENTSDGPTQLALFGRVLVNLESGSLARWTRATPELVELSLDRGRLAVRYDRDQSDPILQIRTPSAIVRVVGTVFTVEVVSPTQTIVSVLRGHVEVLDADSGSTLAEVDAGYRFDAADSTYADVGRIEVAAALPLSDEALDPASEARGAIPQRWIVPGLPEDPERRQLAMVPDPTPTVDEPPVRRHKAKRRPAQSVDEGKDLMTELVAQAERERRGIMRRRLERCRSLYEVTETRFSAASCLEQFMAKYGDDPDAVEGLLLIGMLRMDFAQDYQSATLRFEEFLRRAPNHPRAQLAMYKLTLAAIEGGQIQRALNRGAAYLELYPNGRYVGHILQRFPELRYAI